MTPALMWAMLEKRREHLGDIELPIAHLQCMTYNMNRSQGNPEKGVEPAPYLELDYFRLFGRRDTSLVAKPNPGGDHILNGAQTDRDSWESYGKAGAEVETVSLEPVRTTRIGE